MKNKELEQLQDAVNKYHEKYGSVGELSDSYHTFNELYHHRSILFLCLCLTSFKNYAWKSLLHEKGGDPMYEGMFIMGVNTPFGQATYHYDIDPYWHMTEKIKELPYAPKYDGHTPSQAIGRLLKFANELNKPAIRNGGIYDGISDNYNKLNNISTYNL